MSIRDCFWLGKYKANAPRPILIKLNRAMDAASILSKHDQLPEDISIKPDMTKQLQEQQFVWKLKPFYLKRDGPYRNKEFQRKTSKLGLLFCMSVDKNMQKWWIEGLLSYLHFLKLMQQLQSVTTPMLKVFQLWILVLITYLQMMLYSQNNSLPSIGARQNN